MGNITLNSQGRNLEARAHFNDKNCGIVFAHSFRNNMNIPICSAIEAKLNSSGYTTLAFNFLGHGNSEGALRDVSYKNIGENVSSAIKYLKDNGIKKIGLYGASIGCSAAVFSEEKPDAQIFVNPVAVYNPRLLLDRYSKNISGQQQKLLKDGYAYVNSGSGRGIFEIGADFIKEMEERTDETHRRFRKGNVETLIIQGLNDELLSASWKKVKPWGKFGGNYCLVLGANHNFSNPSDIRFAIELAEQWFNEKL